MKKIQTAVLLAGLSLFGLTACDPTGEHDHPELTSRDAIYEFHCGECHGVDGKGGTVDQATANLMKQMSYNDMLEYVLGDASPERKMPVFEDMSRFEAMNTIDHIWVLRKRNAGGSAASWN